MTADLTHDGRSNATNHKVNGQLTPLPRISSIEIVTTPADNSTYGINEWIGMKVTFDDNVVVTGSPRLRLNIGDMTRTAEFGRGTYEGNVSPGDRENSPEVFFGYKVQAGDSDSDGIAIGANNLRLNSGTIKKGSDNAILTHDAIADNANHKVDGVRPTVSSIAITSDPGDDDTYAIGDSIKVTVTFSEDIAITGEPTLELDFDGTAKTANYLSTGESTAVFAYAVAEGDTDSNGIAIRANRLSLNDGTIKDQAGNPADRTYDAIAADSEHKVDGVYPTFVSAATSTDGTTITLTFSENIAVSAQVSWLSEFLGADQSLILIEVLRVTVAGMGVRPHSANISGTNLTLTLDTPVTQGQTITVSYILGHVSDIFTDTAGNALSAQNVTNNSTVAAGTTSAGLVMNPTELRIDEGTTATYTVALTTQPTADVTVTISSSSSKLSADSTSLTFTTDNWSTGQTVTLTANADDDNYDYWVRVTHTASGGGYDSVHGDLYVVIEDDHE